MEAIKQWLKGERKYLAGVDLYRQHGADKLLLRSFEEAESDFKKKRLCKALQDLIAGAPVQIKTVQAKETKQKQPTSTKQANGWPLLMDDTMRALYNAWRPKFMTMQDLCTRLYDVAMDGESDNVKQLEAGAMCFDIIRLDDACDSIYAKRDFYMINKRLPDDPPPVEIVADPAHQWRAYNNVMRYVRHYKKKVTEQPDKINFHQQLKKYEAARDEYMKILNL